MTKEKKLPIDAEVPIDAKVNKLAVFLRESAFRTPIHQRPYDWDAKTHVRTLLEDLEECIDTDKSYHFLGEIMFIAPPRGEGRLYINDGQQRITTFMLICANLCRHFDECGHTAGVSDALRLLFVLNEGHGETLDKADKLNQRIRLAESDQKTYELLTCGHPVSKNGKMKRAWDEINAFFSAPKYAALPAKKAFFDCLLNKVMVSRLYFEDAADAIPIFEKRNTRGKQLDEIQLVCAHFLYRVQNDEVRSKRLYNQISDVRDSLRNDEKRFADYARCFFQSRYGHLSAKQFCRDLRNAIREEVRQAAPKKAAADEVDKICLLVAEMSQGYRIATFNSLTKKTVEESAWQNLTSDAGRNRKPRKISDYLRDLRRYGQVSNPIMFALLCEYFAIVDSAARPDRAKVAAFVCDSSELLASFIQRTIQTVSGSFATSHYEKSVADLSRQVANGKCATAKNFLAALRAMDEQKIISDDQYIDEMGRTAYATSSAQTKAKYVLARISERIQTGLAVPDDRATLEHILPQSTHFLNGWQLSPDKDAPRVEQHARCVHRLGNLTLLSPDDNKPGDNHNGSFAKKKAIYSRSAYEITKQIHTGWQQWNEVSISERQIKLAEFAARVWPLTIKKD